MTEPRNQNTDPREHGEESNLCAGTACESEQQNRTRLRVVFLPQWYSNPYQRLLDENLRTLGVRVARFRQSVGSILVGLLKHKPHILHLHWLHPFYENAGQRRSWLRMIFSLTALLLLRLCGVRIVWTAHNLKHHEAKESRIDRVFTSLIARYAGAIIVHSNSAKSKLLAQFSKVHLDKVAVIAHGHYIGCYANTVDRARARKQLDLPPRAVVLLFFGQIRPYKGVLELIEAFYDLDRDDAFLVIAGKPLSEPAGDIVRNAVGEHPRILFHPGFVPDDDVQVYMNACDAVVLPYRDALTSGAALLAMSFGRACIAPQTGCFTEVLDEQGAILYEPNQPKGLLVAIQSATDKRDQLQAMGHHNLQKAKEFDWSGIAKRTLEVYESTRSRF